MKRFVLFTLIIILLSGCATIFNSGKETIYFDSEPQSSQVYINDELKGETPLIIDLQHNENFWIRFEKEGYRIHYDLIEKEFQGYWLLVDVLNPLNYLVFQIPILINMMTGAYFDPNNTYIKAYLVKTSDTTLKSHSEYEKPIGQEEALDMEQGAWYIEDISNNGYLPDKIISNSDSMLTVSIDKEIVNIPISSLKVIKFDHTDNVSGGILWGLLSWVGSAVIAGIIISASGATRGDGNEMAGIGYGLIILGALPLFLLVGGLIGASHGDENLNFFNMTTEEKKQLIEEKIFGKQKHNIRKKRTSN
ncbi:MAG: PEGA domain-containing protein [Bacteroidetes bacterium]|nr:MAG: PEGA domain-containing protein [Bacteroidota bacterium]